MVKLEEVVDFISGTPQFRIREVLNTEAQLYTYYGQSELEADLTGIDSNNKESKQVRTLDSVNVLARGDLIFSLISGKSTVVSANHQGYLYTQNYVKLVTDKQIDSKYLSYLLNEDPYLKKQLQLKLQGSQVLKYTLRQVKELELLRLHDLKRQRTIGELYFDQLRLETLKNRMSKLETTLVLQRLEEENRR